MNPPCPACHSARTAWGERVPVSALASVWAPAWPAEPKPTVDAVQGWIAADLGTDAVAFARCDNCGLEFASPMRSWSAAHYPAQSHGLGFDHAQALDDLAGRPGGAILEIGCGCGEFLERAAILGHRPIGLDFSASSVAAARASGTDARELSIADLLALPDRPPAFDSVALFQVIEHLDDPDAVFADVGKLVHPGSRLYVGCPSPDRFTRRVRHAHRVGASDYWDFPPQHTLRWTPAALNALLRRHGWEVERTAAEPYNPVGAAAELTAIDGTAGGWYRIGWRRRLATALWRARLAVMTAFRPATGTRLFVQARRPA